MTGLRSPSASHSRRRSSAQVRMFQNPALLRSLRPWPRRSKYRTWKSSASGPSADLTVMWSRPGPPWTATRTGRSTVVSPRGMTHGPDTSNQRDTSPRLIRIRPPRRPKAVGAGLPLEAGPRPPNPGLARLDGGRFLLELLWLGRCLMEQLARPPYPPAQIQVQRGDEHRPDHDRVQQHAEGEREPEFGQERHRQRAQRRER